MADRYEKSFTRKPAGSEPAGQRPASQDDPLVELARIVSGNQSFDDIVGRPAAQPAMAPRPVQAQRAPTRDLSFDLESELLNDLQSSFDPASRAAPPRAPAPEPRTAQPAVAPRESFDHMRLRPGQPQAQAPSWTAPRQSDPEEDPYSGTAYAAGDFDRSADPFAAPRAATRAPVAPAPEPASTAQDDYYYDDDPAEPGYDDTDYGEDRFGEYDGYDAEPPRRSRKPLIIAAIGLAVVLAGGLAALALKGNSSSTSASAPKVIVADEAPTKVQPAAQPATDDGQQNKLIFDRANPDAAPQEQLVLPDDGAVDAAPASNESAASREISRIILPGAPGDNSSAPDTSAAAPADGGQDGNDAVPRKVRTVVIKPDGTIVSSQATAKDAPAASTDVAAAEPAAPAPAASDAAPSDAAPAASAPAAAEPAATEPAAPAPAIIVPQPAAEPDAAPSSKDTSQMAAPRVAPKPALRPAPADTAPAATSSAGSGGFVVQVTSQRSQDQAATAYRALQRKFPDILGSRSPDIVRADLGAKGVYYRARVGPMATRDEAISLCEALKASGGACIVQKN